MGAATFLQTSFLGGEWSPFAQGRVDLPRYKIALNSCLNAYPIEEGALPRRSGTRFAATTRDGAPAQLLPFVFTEASPYNMEFTPNHLRFFNGADLVTDADDQVITGVSGANPAVFTVPATATWAAGDSVLFRFPTNADVQDAVILRNRQFVITNALTNKTFTLQDPITGDPINGADIAFVSANMPTMAKITDILTSWGFSAYATVRSVQDLDKTGQPASVLLQTATKPQQLLVTTEPTGSDFAVFDLTEISFVDGPYLDPPTDGCRVSVNQQTNPVVLTFDYPAYSAGVYYDAGTKVTVSGVDYVSLQNVNVGNTPASSPTYWEILTSGSVFGPSGAQTTDIGRLIRIQAVADAWDAATSYTTLYTPVTYNDAFYVLVHAASDGGGFGNAPVGVPPPSDPKHWYPSPENLAWVWGRISAVSGPATVTWIINDTQSVLPYDGPFDTFRIGVFSDTSGYPKCGTWHEGRLWLSGVVGNRVDASVPGDPYNFAPTLQDGSVTDSSAIAYTFNSADQNEIFWMTSHAQGIVCGTLAGEWLIQASALNDPLTPTTIQAHRVTKYGCADIEPRITGLSTVFVHKYERRLMEFITDVFSGKFSAPNLSWSSKHLTASGIKQVVYQEELTPIVWARMGDGSLIGATYRRNSSFATEDPTFIGWHRHELGSERTIASVCVGPSVDGLLDTLAMVTEDPAAEDPPHVELLTKLYDEDNVITDAWFLDDAVAPSGAFKTTQAGVAGVVLYGLWHLNGKTATAWIGGLDCGDYAVASGQMFVPFSTGNSLFTAAYLASLDGVDYGATAVPYEVAAMGTIMSVPGVVGFTYTTQGQLLRPVAPADTGAQNGPALGKTRREHKFSALMHNTQGIEFGTDFTDTSVPMRPAAFKTPGGTPYTALQLFSGVYRGTLESRYDYDGRICWQITRPYPATILSVGGFIHTQDI